MEMRRVVTTMGLVLVMMATTGCSVFFYPHAKDFAAKAKGSDTIETLLNLTTMMEDSAKQAEGGRGYDQPLNDLHNQFHAFDNQLCCMEKPTRETPAYDLVVTHNKELWAIFKRAWKYRDSQPQRQQHLNLFGEELREMRVALQGLK